MHMWIKTPHTPTVRLRRWTAGRLGRLMAGSVSVCEMLLRSNNYISLPVVVNGRIRIPLQPRSGKLSHV